jgi:glycine C-acetyltransferase
MTTATGVSPRKIFAHRTDQVLAHLQETGQFKKLQMIEGPMDATVTLRGYGEVGCFCSNNYLGLANHPAVKEAGIEGIKKYGAGTASVRFICGTFEPHEALEKTIAEFFGVEAAYSFVSCWTATEAVFPTFCEPGDIIISDELNHACIIDSMRLAGALKKGTLRTVYKSMEGDIAKMPEMRKLCDEFGAIFVVDDSHGTGVLGKTGRGTHEHHGMPGTAIDFYTSTLGKALGGGAGGFVAGSRQGIDLIVQRARPTLFTNALPVTVACSARKAIEILMAEPQRVQKLRENVAYARKGIRDAGFEVLESPTAICPIIVGDTAKAIAMSNRLLELGRLRAQISAGHEPHHLDQFIDGLKKLKSEFSETKALP